MWTPSVSAWASTGSSPAALPGWGGDRAPDAPWGDLATPVGGGDELLSGQWRTVALGQEPWAIALCVLMGLVLVGALWRGRRYMVYRLRGLFASERRFAHTGDFTAARAVSLLTGLLLVGCASGALLLVACLPYGVWTRESWSLWLLSLGALAGGLCLKVGAYGLVGWIFLPKDARRAWIGAYLLLTSCLSAPLFALCVLRMKGLMGTGEMAVCLLFLLILYEILLFYRLRGNFSRQIGGQALAFVYLCTLEIAPLLVAGRFLSILSEV